MEPELAQSVNKEENSRSKCPNRRIYDFWPFLTTQKASKTLVRRFSFSRASDDEVALTKLRKDSNPISTQPSTQPSAPKSLLKARTELVVETRTLNSSTCADRRISFCAFRTPCALFGAQVENAQNQRAPLISDKLNDAPKAGTTFLISISTLW